MGLRTGILLVLLLQVGCGFHLRGSFVPPHWLHDVAVQLAGPADTLHRELLESLRTSGVSLQADTGQTGAVIRLGAETLNRRLLASGSGSRVKDYEFKYEVPVTVVDPEGLERLAQEKITVFREMDYDETQVLAKASEQDEMKKQMARDAVRQIMRRLQARQIQ